MAISNIFEIGKRSLLAYQSAINTTSENIANANNADYSRRRVELSQLILGFSGLGIGQDESTRMRQRFAQHQLWSENQHLHEYAMNNTLLHQVEDIFAEATETGITSLISDFWNSWNDLANDPESEYARILVRDKGNLLAEGFGRVHQDLREMQGQIRPEVDTRVMEVNNTLDQILELNKQLRYDQNPSLLDTRDQLIEKLSQEFNINIKEKENGEVSIYVDGYLLVSDQSINHLKTGIETVGNENMIRIYLGDSDKIVAPGSGALKSLLDTHNEVIPDNLAKLDELAVHIAGEINQVHVTGENLTGTTNISFFAVDVSGAADFRVNDAILNDMSLIAARLSTEGEGSGSIAQAISDMQFNKDIHGTTDLEYYHSMLTELGNKINEADFLQSSQQLIVDQIYNQKEAVTGVSLDEEMTRLIQFQQAYQAAAKIVTTVDEMVNTILGLK